MERKHSVRLVPLILTCTLLVLPICPASPRETLHGNGGSGVDLAVEDAEQDARIEEAYQRGTEALDARQWDKAVTAFEEVIRANGSRADGALYWKAYSQNKLGQRDAALGTLGKLTASHPKSRWIGDAKALELEVRQSMGQAAAPEDQADDDLKLMAINSLMNTDSERALPMLEKILNGNQPPKFKERALMVLAQSGSARAREVLLQVARGKSNPGLQAEALKYVGLFGGKESRQTLTEIYSSTSDVKIKRQILQAFMIGGDRERLLAVAKEEKDPELRRSAIQQLGVTGAQDELWAMYQTLSDQVLKESVLHALFISGSTDRLAEVARNEKDQKLRNDAIHMLGISDSKKTAVVLLSLYEDQTDVSVRKAALEGLFLQGNANALIQLARKEKNQEMKKEIVGRLSVMGSKEATDFLMEILNK